MNTRNPDDGSVKITIPQLSRRSYTEFEVRVCSDKNILYRIDNSRMQLPFYLSYYKMTKWLNAEEKMLKIQINTIQKLKAHIEKLEGKVNVGN